MKVNFIFNEEEVLTTNQTQKQKMSFSSEAQQILFNMMSKNIYSNPIGSIIREITSNCYDSHKEANVNFPIALNLTKDSSGNYISFIDKGIGMSPERIEKIYINYFSSTKRDSNDEIGGFGIGSKSVFAYANSFFVITRSEKENQIEYNNNRITFLENNIIPKLVNLDGSIDEINEIINTYGTIESVTKEIDGLLEENLDLQQSDLPTMEYHYSIYKGNDSPMVELMYKTLTSERNGTEVKIPVKDNDISTFEKEIVKQLHYFENIIFKGFSSYVSNDYQIYKGDKFLFRVNNESDSSPYYSMHVCLGNVAYPIDYSVLNLHEGNYRVPVGIKLNIGDINVTASRENLDYNSETIALLQKKIKETKDELIEKLMKQYEDIVTINDYYNNMSNFGYLHIKNQKLYIGNMINKSDVSLVNFKYNALKHSLPTESNIVQNLFTIKEMGDRQKYGNWSSSLNSIEKKDNVYFVDGDFERTAIKSQYLNWLHNRKYYILIPNKFSTEFLDKLGIYESSHINYDLAMSLKEDIIDYVKNNSTDYNSVVPTDEFYDYKKSKRRGKSKNNTSEHLINIKLNTTYTKKISIATISEFKGKIFYGFKEDRSRLTNYQNVYIKYFKNNLYNKVSYSEIITPKQGVMFIEIGKGNEKYIKNFKNVHYLDRFETNFLYRVADRIIEDTHMDIYYERFENLDSIYGKEGFDKIDKKIYDYYKTLKNKCHSRKTIYGLHNFRELFKQSFDNYKFPLEKELIYVEEFHKKNNKYFQHIRAPYYSFHTDETLIEVYKMIINGNI